jgi:hypothetical protein
MTQQSIVRGLGVAALVFTVACGGGSDRPPAATSPTPPSPGAPLPALTVERLDVERSSLDGGQTTNATVLLSRQAPAEGTVVTISASDPAVSVPASVSVAAGQSVATFQVITREVDGDTPVTITASTTGQMPREASVSVNTLARLESFSRVSPYVRGGTRGSVTIRLPSRATRRLVMRIASSNPAMVAPQTATIEPGNAVLNFEFSTPFVGDDTETVLSTSVGGQPFSQQIIVNPLPWIEFTNSSGGGIPPGRTRFDAANSIFRSTTCCRASQILADVNYGFGSGYLIYFRAPSGTVINPGTYESSSGRNIPGFSLASDNGAAACSGGSTSRVTVNKASFQPSGTINRFDATFEQRCSNGGSVSGTISLDAAFAPPYAALACAC